MIRVQYYSQQIFRVMQEAINTAVLAVWVREDLCIEMKTSNTCFSALLYHRNLTNVSSL